MPLLKSIIICSEISEISIIFSDFQYYHEREGKMKKMNLLID